VVPFMPLRPTLAPLALALLPTACARETKRPNVLIVVIDTLRADRLGAYGNTRGLTPFLDELASRGTLFERAYAPSSWTMPSVASLLTSRYPTQHRVTTFSSRLTEDEITLPEILRDAGWRAGGFSANPSLRPEAGFGQGFDEFWTNLTATVDLPGDELRTRALAWLDRVRGGTPRAPVVLYLQYMEPHEPYAPREPFRSRFAVDDDGKPIGKDISGVVIRDLIERAHPGTTVDERGRPLDMAVALQAFAAHPPPSDELAALARAQAHVNERLYDADVAAADDQVRRLFEALEGRGFLDDDTMVIITADHGEEFLDHGGSGHGFALYEESVRIPLILIGPGVPRGRRVRENVSLIDLAPTVLDLLGLPAPPRFEGRSLAHAPATSDAVLLQLDPLIGGHTERRVHSRGIVRHDDKLLTRRDGGTEVYDLATDPHEKHSLASGDAGALREALSSAEASLGQRAGQAEFAPVDDGMKARLRALGYTQ
jgi:arylsulfatase A-like enzyme